MMSSSTTIVNLHSLFISDQAPQAISFTCSGYSFFIEITNIPLAPPLSVKWTSDTGNPNTLLQMMKQSCRATEAAD